MNRRLAIALFALVASIAACERIVELSPGSSGPIQPDAIELIPDAAADAPPVASDGDAPPVDADIDAT